MIGDERVEAKRFETGGALFAHETECEKQKKRKKNHVHHMNEEIIKIITGSFFFSFFLTAY